MKSGLYACAGASATASAAAWAKRFDEPITNRSNVYFGLDPAAEPARSGAGRSAARRPRRPAAAAGRAAPALGTVSCTRRSWPVASLTAGADQPEEVALDPLAREVVRHGEHERVVGELDAADLAEPGAVRRLVERPSSRPETSSHRLSAVSSIWCSTPGARLLHSRRRSGDHSSVRARAQQRGLRSENGAICRDFRHSHTTLHRCGKTVGRRSPTVPVCGLFTAACGPVDNRSRDAVSILPARAVRSVSLSAGSLLLEAHLPAKRAPPEAQARLPCAHVDARRPRDPQAPPRQGPQAPVGLTAASPAAISTACSAATASPARGTSTPSTGRAARSRRASSSSTGSRARRTTRASRGSGSRCRSRRATRSCATGSSASCARSGARSRTARVPGHDYVLVARPGPAEAAEARGHDWLVERVDEVLEKTARRRRE